MSSADEVCLILINIILQIVMRNYDIQNLRAYGMIAILLGHMPIVLPGVLLHGYTFVSLFLAIAGYFTVLQFEKRYADTDFRRIKVVEREVVNRFFRLIPLMLFWIMLYYLISHIGYCYGWTYGDDGRWLAELKSAALMYYNYYLAGLKIGGLFGQFWTLYVEIHLFIILVIVLVLFRKRKVRIAVISAIILSTVFILRPLTPDIMVRYATHAQADSFFGGALLALLVRGDQKVLKCNNIDPLIRKSTGLFLVAVLFLSGFFFDN